jgi:hypothetical protein
MVDRLCIGACTPGDLLQASHLHQSAIGGAVELSHQASCSGFGLAGHRLIGALTQHGGLFAVGSDCSVIAGSATNFAALGPLKASASTKRLGKSQNCQQHSRRKPWRTTPLSKAYPLRRRRTVDCPSRTPLKVLNLTSTSLGFLRERCKALARLASAPFLALGLVRKSGGRPGRQRQHHEHVKQLSSCRPASRMMRLGPQPSGHGRPGSGGCCFTNADQATQSLATMRRSGPDRSPGTEAAYHVG